MQLEVEDYSDIASLTRVRKRMEDKQLNCCRWFLHQGLVMIYEHIARSHKIIAIVFLLACLFL